MALEMWSVAALALMLLAITLVQGALVPMTQGFGWGLGSRDTPAEFSALQGRFSRTVQNQIEAILMFAPLMVLAIMLERTSEMTELAAWLVIIGRGAFILLYLTGTFGLRSAAYAVGMLGTFITAYALFAG
jgi:uncharacterized MAPEG superfamily protein